MAKIKDKQRFEEVALVGSKMTDEALIDNTSIDAILPFLFRASGRYTFNLSSIPNIKPSKDEILKKNPIYYQNEPPYEFKGKTQAYKLETLGGALHIDIDGTNPLNVVSGTIGTTFRVFTPEVHFIGRVTSNTVTSDGIELVVEDLHVPGETAFRWHGTGKIIDRIEVLIRSVGLMEKAADVTFLSGEDDTHYGPYTCNRQSIYYRNVEIELEREADAVVVESYNNHDHPNRPADLNGRLLTLERAYRDAGIYAWINAEGNIINSCTAGADNKWTKQELHDAMEVHWSDFANRAQWKLWAFLAELAEDTGLAGVMFDGNIDEPGGVDRQGAAVFTKAEWLFSETGDFGSANPPAAEAVKRERFFVLVHEIGHCFNLFHPWQKYLGTPWDAPVWMPVVVDNQALTWMNYPYSADPNSGYGAKWFYDRFYFRFTDEELLFLRHAPEAYGKMGGEAWSANHGLLNKNDIDHRLQFSLFFPNKQVFELGEMIFAELKLKNISQETVRLSGNLELPNGFVEIGITKPDGKKTPLLPIECYLKRITSIELKPGESIYQTVNISLGKAGFTFKETGYYRLEAAYFDGKTGAVAVNQIYIKPPSNYDHMLVFNHLYDARTLRAIYFGGTRVMNDVNDNLMWIIRKLGKNHPLSIYLNVLVHMPKGKPFKTFDQKSNKIKLLPGEPDKVIRELDSLFDNGESLVCSIGNIRYHELVDAYTDLALKAGKSNAAVDAQTKMLALFRKTKVTSHVVDEIENKISSMKL